MEAFEAKDAALPAGGRVAVHVTLNGKKLVGTAEPRQLLVDFIRDELGWQGTRVGCEHGVCGACTVLYNGHPARSCLLLAVQAEGADIVTVEGLHQDARGPALKEAFAAEHALQCGFCTSGMLVTAWQILGDNLHPAPEAIREQLSGNLCRCTGYDGIIRAIRRAGDALDPEQGS